MLVKDYKILKCEKCGEVIPNGYAKLQHDKVCCSSRNYWWAVVIMISAFGIAMSAYYFVKDDLDNVLGYNPKIVPVNIIDVELRDNQDRLLFMNIDDKTGTTTYAYYDEVVPLVPKIIKGKISNEIRFPRGSKYLIEEKNSRKYYEITTRTKKIYHKIDNNWYRIKYKRISNAVANKTIESFALGGGQIFGAALDIDSNATDGWAHNTVWGSSWNAAHDNTGSGFYSDSVTAYSRRNSSSQYLIYRGFMPFDTSSIDDDATIDSAVLNVVVSSVNDGQNDAYGYVNIVLPTTPASDPTIVADDFDQCGAVDNPTKASNDDKNITGLSGSISWTLNSAGLSNINKTGWTTIGFREGHDIEDIALTSNGQSSVALKQSENTGQEPNLVIQYSVAGGAAILYEDDLMMMEW